MAKFEMELPTDLIKSFQGLEQKTGEALEIMTEAGAEYVAQKIKATAPKDIRDFVKITKPYKTPSDGGINTKVYVSGYLPFSNPNRVYFTRSGGGGKSYSTTKGVPADFLAMLYEYGRSTAPFPKHPFLRKAFKDKGIEEAMINAPKLRAYKDLWGSDDFVSNWISNLR